MQFSVLCRHRSTENFDSSCQCGGEVSARVLFDGTHGLSLNTRTRIRDQERSPVASDLKHTMRKKAALDEATFALTADVSEAHRQIPIHPCDWRRLHQYCRYVWCSVCLLLSVAGVGCAGTTYTVSCLEQSAHLAHGGGRRLPPGGQEYRTALIAFFVLCSTVIVPLSWAKTAGGDTWVGFELLHQSRLLGVSQRRAEWFVKWAREVAAAETVHMTRFEEVLGRTIHVVGALEVERPFLGPLWRYMSLHPRNSVQKIPGYFRFFLRYLADQVATSRHYHCAVELHASTLAPRVDAQASSTRTGFGGWFPAAAPDGKIGVSISRWFSLEIRQEEWPWLYAKRRKPALVMATLEALAVLVALNLWFGEVPKEQQTGVVTVPSLNKLMTTKFPSSALLMELSTYMKRMSMRTVVEWFPRECNREADRLATSDTVGFDTALRVRVTSSSLHWYIRVACGRSGRDGTPTSGSQV